MKRSNEERHWTIFQLHFSYFFFGRMNYEMLPRQHQSSKINRLVQGFQILINFAQKKIDAVKSFGDQSCASLPGKLVKMIFKFKHNIIIKYTILM